MHWPKTDRFCCSISVQDQLHQFVAFSAAAMKDHPSRSAGQLRGSAKPEKGHAYGIPTARKDTTGAFWRPEHSSEAVRDGL